MSKPSRKELKAMDAIKPDVWYPADIVNNKKAKIDVCYFLTRGYDYDTKRDEYKFHRELFIKQVLQFHPELQLSFDKHNETRNEIVFMYKELKK